jgi:AcrR family transcriptional regulator
LRVGPVLPTIYHYFGDKANLYLEVCLAKPGCLAPSARLRAAIDRARQQRTEKARLLVDLASDLLENENFFKLMHREMIDQSRGHPTPDRALLKESPWRSASRSRRWSRRVATRRPRRSRASR